MTIIRWQQRPAMANLLNNFVEREFSTGYERNCGCAPATNILEKDNEYEIQLVVPGMTREDFHMEVEDNVLTVTYEKKENEDTNDDNKFLRKEFSLEGFNRKFTIPKHADAENIRARYEKGMLYISIPREDPKRDKLSKRIEIA
jgi:HSP20 family protein